VDQKRQFPRYALEAAVTLVAGARTVAGRTANLSRGGLCAIFDENLPIGTRVNAELALVFENDTLSETLSLVGRVVWSTAVEGRYQIGLAFQPLNTENARFLDLFLRFLAEGQRTRATASSGSRDPFDS